MHRNPKTASAVCGLSFVLTVAAALSAPDQALASEVPAPAAAVSTIVAQHAIAQQGLSIGLAAGFVQGHIAIFSAPGQLNTCRRLIGGGSVQTLRARRVGNTTRTTIELYYDNACRKRYINARLVARKPSPTGLAVMETATLYGLTGSPIAQLALSGTAVIDVPRIDILSAKGTLTPAGSTAVDIGLDCDFPELTTANPTGTVACHVGIAQTLPAAGGDIASVTPITVNVSRDSTRATFTANRAQLATGATGALGIATPTNHSLRITGQHTTIGRASGHGAFAVFSVFQRGPSSWVSTSTANNVRFAISMPARTNKLHGTIKALNNNATLATFTVDRSGTGTITYSNSQNAAIKSWVVTN